MNNQASFDTIRNEFVQLVERLSGRRVLWLIPEFHALATAGRHEYSQASALDLLLPLIERGEIKVVGETELEAYERLVRGKPGGEQGCETNANQDHQSSQGPPAP